MASVCVGLMMLCAVGAVDPSQVDSVQITEPDPPAPAQVVQECDLPICGPLGRRLYCIEGLESRHDGGAVNRSSGARGYLQWLGSTARSWGVRVGDRQSEWSAAARIASRGESFFRSQWPVTAALCA